MYEKPIGRPGWYPFDALVDVPTAANRYDLALGIVPVAFLGALVVANALGVSVLHALGRDDSRRLLPEPAVDRESPERY